MKSLIAAITIASALSAEAHNLTIRTVTANTIVVDSDLFWLGGNDTEATHTPFGYVTASGFVSSDGWIHNQITRNGITFTFSHHVNSIIPFVNGIPVQFGSGFGWQYIIPKGRTLGFWRYTVPL